VISWFKKHLLVKNATFTAKVRHRVSRRSSRPFILLFLRRLFPILQSLFIFFFDFRQAALLPRARVRQVVGAAHVELSCPVA
jgi:hypothetical protein